MRNNHTQTMPPDSGEYYENGAAAQHSALDLYHYIGLVLRYRWLLIIPFCLSLAVGIYLAVTLPKEYKADTLILVEPQKVPTDYVRSLVASSIAERISTISQQIKSRTNLIKIIKEFNLFSEPEYKEMFLEDKLESLRERIQVTIDEGLTDTKTQNAEAFSISFQGQDPERVMRVTNALATYFIDQNLKKRESYAIGTKDFLSDELEMMRINLERVENTLKQFRGRYMGELPEQLPSNLGVLDRLQAQLNRKEQTIRDEKNRLALIDSKIQMARQQAVSLTAADQLQSGEPTSLEDLKKLLQAYRARYTAKHPDVLRLEKRVAALEKTEGGLPHGSSKDQDKDSPGSETLKAESPEVAELLLQRETVRQEIVAQQRAVAKILQQIKRYQKRVENTPKREQELLTLTRDYENIKATYNSMLERKLEADIAVNMEKKQQGEQFRIVDPARVPHKPVSPNMKRLFMLVLVAGLGIGGGIIFLKESLNRSVGKPEAFASATGIPVLAAIPAIMHTKDVVLKRINLMCSLSAVTVSLALLGCFAAVSILNYGPVIRIVSRYISHFKFI